MMSNNSNGCHSEFLEAVITINLLNRLLDDGNDKKFLISVKINKTDNSKLCVFKVISKDKLWLKYYNFEEFTLHKQKMGFEANWFVFFKSFMQALNNSDGGDISLKIIKKPKNSLLLTIIHPISEDVKIKSEIVFDKCYMSDSDEFRNYNYEMMLELYESKQSILKESKLAISKIEDKKSNFSNGTSFTGQLEIKKNLKRKFNSDLINPNAKKRKIKGASFTNVDDQIVESD